MKNFLRGLLLIVILIVALAIWIVLPWYGVLALAVLLALWLIFARRGRQTMSVTNVGLSTLPSRWGASSVIIIGIAGVVGVLVALLAMAEGFQATLKQTGSDDTVIVMRAGSQAELNSVLDHDSAVLIEQAPGVAKDARGQPVASPELVVVASLPKKSNGLDANVEIRGVGDQAWTLRPNIKIIAGRKFKPGLRELDVGKGALHQFAGVGIGSTLTLNNQTWNIVGEFDSGDALNSEMWGDVDVVGSTYRRGSSVATVTAKLTSADAFDKFKTALSTDPRLKVDAQTTRAYYTQQSEGLSRLIRILGTTVGVIMAIGAIFGALNTMFAAVATRAREIATLRALGFRGAPVVASVMLETMLLALAGGVLGALVAWAIFDHYTVSTLGANFSQVVFQFRVSPALLWSGIKWALAIGFVGGLFPAVRAARLPVTTALREL